MDIQFGLYDRVMDSELEAAVSELDRALVAVETQQLDPGDSHTFLARHSPWPPVQRAPWPQPFMVRLLEPRLWQG